MACSSLRSNTEPEDKLDAALVPDAWSASGLNDSCGSDVGDELLPELTNNSGTTRGTRDAADEFGFGGGREGV